METYHDELWLATDHIDEFKIITKKLLFIAQGDVNAPVTQDNLDRNLREYVQIVGEPENIWFWSSQQLCINQANNLDRVIFTSFYSTGKTKLMMKRADTLNSLGEKVLFIVANSVKNHSKKLALTLQLEQMFRGKKNIEVHEIGYGIKNLPLIARNNNNLKTFP